MKYKKIDGGYLTTSVYFRLILLGTDLYPKWITRTLAAPRIFKLQVLPFLLYCRLDVSIAF